MTSEDFNNGIRRDVESGLQLCIAENRLKRIWRTGNVQKPVCHIKSSYCPNCNWNDARPSITIMPMSTHTMELMSASKLWGLKAKLCFPRAYCCALALFRTVHCHIADLRSIAPFCLTSLLFPLTHCRQNALHRYIHTVCIDDFHRPLLSILLSCTHTIPMHVCTWHSAVNTVLCNIQKFQLYVRGNCTAVSYFIGRLPSSSLDLFGQEWSSDAS